MIVVVVVGVAVVVAGVLFVVVGVVAAAGLFLSLVLLLHVDC